MPKHGYNTITVPKELYEIIKKRAGTKSPAQFLREILTQEVVGLGNPGSRTATALGGQVNGAEVKPTKGDESKC
ncbi:MAG: hypothetical protein QXS29_06170 [Nitrososphaeria archaeon]